MGERRVVCAANKSEETGLIVCGPRHFDQTMHAVIDRCGLSGTSWEQGFVDQFGVFMSRQEAAIVAERAGQLLGREKAGPAWTLFSEDLY